VNSFVVLLELLLGQSTFIYFTAVSKQPYPVFTLEGLIMYEANLLTSAKYLTNSCMSVAS